MNDLRKMLDSRTVRACIKAGAEHIEILRPPRNMCFTVKNEDE